MELIHLRALAHRFGNISAALTEIANLEAILTLPTPTVHVVSDVHGEYEKLRLVINNASGSLRPLVERLLGSGEILDLIYHPRETYQARTAGQLQIGSATLYRKLKSYRLIDNQTPDAFSSSTRSTSIKT